MKVIVVNNYEAMVETAQNFVANAMLMNPKMVLGLATGSTPEGLYQRLIKNKKLVWNQITTFNLDEYIGLKPSSTMSYHYYMQTKLFDHVGLKKINTNLPSGTGNIEANARDYDRKIDKSGGIDLQILGIGENGHIAFNEPGSSEKSKTRRVQLTASTIKANARYFSGADRVPTEAITMGIGQILKSKAILLLASGSQKAQAIKATIEGPITPDVPASFLQNHHNVTIIIDQEAAQLLARSG